MRTSPARLRLRALDAAVLRDALLSARGALGRAGESLAERYLTRAGFVVVGRNVRGPSGEIDLIARDGGVLVFIEVKARTGTTYGRALAAVDVRKRARLRAAAADFLQMHAPRALARFDVLAIDGDDVRHHRAAF